MAELVRGRMVLCRAAGAEDMEVALLDVALQSVGSSLISIRTFFNRLRMRAVEWGDCSPGTLPILGIRQNPRLV